MKKRNKRTSKIPERSLPSYVEEFAKHLRMKKTSGMFSYSFASKAFPTVVQQIAKILREDVESKPSKKGPPRSRRSKRIKK